MWGIIPAAGTGSRIQPLAFSKELLPVGSRLDGETERPRAVCEYLVERMILAGANKLCFVISPGKYDILQYFSTSYGPADICYVVQRQPGGLCDAVFHAAGLINPDEPVLVGLPDTIWFPADGLRALGDGQLSFLLFPVDQPELFDVVETDEQGNVRCVRVKEPDTGSKWIWGAFKMPGSVLHELHDLWRRPGRGDEYIGTLVNAYLSEGGRAVGVRAGEAYVDVGTLHGYREAIHLVGAHGNGPETREPGPSGSKAAAAYAHAGQAPGVRNETQAEEKTPPAARDPEHIRKRVRELGAWFHNIDLGGVPTAPDHFLGDYPRIKWERFSHRIPDSLNGMSVLDIGCNAGFYSIQMKKRGARRVVGIDNDERYLAQARFAAEVSGFSDIEFMKLSVYDVADLGERFDLVLFMGVLYHLRYPMLALDLLHRHVTRDLLVFQSMHRGSSTIEPLEEDYSFWRTGIFDRPGYPKLHFVERRYSGDITNWWIPNRACTEAMLRSSGYTILAHPEKEVYVCRHYELETEQPEHREVS
jgi:tRNA (mo5U34)-methyltransferase